MEAGGSGSIMMPVRRVRLNGMEDMFRFGDELGPAKVLSIFLQEAGLKAVVAVDNVAIGPSIGGIRMAPDVSATEAFQSGGEIPIYSDRCLRL